MEGGGVDGDLKIFQGLPDDPEIRMGFVKKVYGILSVQMLYTTAFSGYCLAKKGDPGFVKMLNNPVFVIVVLFFYIASFCALMLCRMDKKVPTNYILLSIFTICLSCMVGAAVMEVQEPIIVVEAAALTMAVVLGVTIYAATTKTDFVIWGPIIHIVILLTMVVLLFVSLFGPKLNFVFAAFGVFLSSFYLLYDT